VIVVVVVSVYLNFVIISMLFGVVILRMNVVLVRLIIYSGIS